MPIFAPVFCRGVLRTTAIDIGSVGSRQILPVSTTGYVVGQHLFACKADNSQATYLGKITVVGGALLTFQFPLPRAFNSADKLVVPEVVWQASSASAAGGVDFSRESGIETLDTTGKELIHTKTREARDFVELTIQSVPAADWQAYKGFVEDEIADGLSRFVAAYWDGDSAAVRCDLVKLRSPGAALSARRQAAVLRSWAVELQVVLEGVYG